ncbi:MAG: sulfotransferase family 2 domain-containing protein, partial [Elainella sp.]
LDRNQPHQFAASHALRLYHANAIYSFIPKNGCSSLRVSLAIANGCITDLKDFNWIHKNNATFKADLASLVTASYTFTILRCPFARLASVYLDKIVSRTPEVWQLRDSLKRTLEPEELTFKAFISALTQPTILKSNIHWQPQVDFLVYQQYDDYFCLENFSHAVKTLQEKINLTVIDARPLTKHGIDSLEKIEGNDFSSVSPAEIQSLKSSGQCPSPRTLYNEELIDTVKTLFKADIDLYTQLFGRQNLMFSYKK